MLLLGQERYSGVTELFIKVIMRYFLNLFWQQPINHGSNRPYNNVEGVILDHGQTSGTGNNGSE